MNFFCVAFFIVALQVNISESVNYIIKLVGLLFFIGGILEISGFNKSFKRFLTPVKFLVLLSALASALFLIFTFTSVTAGVKNITGIIIGTVITLLALLFQKSLLKLISDDKELVNDLSNVIRFQKSWNKLAAITIANLVFDIINRVMPVKIIADLSGLMMAVSKIVMYIFALIILFSANKIRVDFNKKHSI
ncbi:MAG: hypothetical protein K2F81_00740 [Ruminococcus sp.]|nr:hypothetical protein [Ruminococcus sp.]